MHHGDAGVPMDALVAGVLLPFLLIVGYLCFVSRARRRNPARPWRARRTVAFLVGAGLLAVALLPPLASFAHRDFRGHMLQHLLIGMYAPLALVLGAPVTLLLRGLPTGAARRLSRLVHSGPVRVLARPVVALALSVGSLGALYFTPLYDATAGRPVAHGLLHLNFLLSGCLFAWVIAGLDPAPNRPSVPVRLVVLGVAVAAHATLSQLLYAGVGVGVHAPGGQVRGGAEIMYYGGDIAELLLAGALIATWRPDRRRGRVTGAEVSRTGNSRTEVQGAEIPGTGSVDSPAPAPGAVSPRAPGPLIPVDKPTRPAPADGRPGPAADPV
ncbi:cytochrome c oxidase assembly protein [Streptomyces sp. NPDC003077]|uniref:cytochrome c oxidase assembly protein n=1 Tax=Streptomyces sp. NPDC003077 TaxID=3154443 RepID=UPI00339EDBE4